MDTLQRALSETLVGASWQAFADLIADKLSDQGVTLSARERQKLTKRLKSGTIDSLQFRRWQWWSNKHVDLEMSEQEIESIHERFTEFIENKLPALITLSVDELSAKTLDRLHRNWTRQLRLEERQSRGFQKLLYQQWGHAIDLLRMFLAIARGFGEDLNTSLQSNSDVAQPVLVNVLLRLHARACQVTEEIICLLSVGLADGAMGRWRTLHEIAVVALFLKDQGENLAIRYVDHDVIESYRAATEYQVYCSRMGYEPLSASELDEVQQAFDDAVASYGTSFKNPYGWAADTLGVGSPTFRDLERAVGIDYLRAHYRLASHNVHANPKGVFFKLGLVEEVDILLAGPSSAGLADPGHDTAISLLQVSMALGLIESSLDSLVSLKVLFRLMEEIGEAFGEAQRKGLSDYK